MKRFAGMMLLVMGILLITQTIAAQEWSQPWARERIEKSPRHSEWITVKHDGRNVETFVVYPESKDKRPVVLIIHEIFGLSDWAQELADEVAAAGYIGVAPDLLSGMGPNGGPPNDFPRGVTEASRDYGLKLASSDGKIYVGCFCWGGAQSFRFATNRGDLSAAFVFYGSPPPTDDMSRIKAPVYGFYAGNDVRIDATIPDTIAAMKAAGKTYGPVTYEGAGHGFMRAGEAPDASEANKKAQEESWKRWKSLLAH